MSKERQTATRKDQRGRNLKKGEGQDKNGRYYYCYTDTTGKRKRIYNTDLIELREQEEEIKKALDNNIDISTAQKRTLNNQFEIYLKTKNIKETTKEHYIYSWNLHIRDNIGKMKLIDIKKSDVLIFYNDLSKSGIKDSSMHVYINLLNPVLEMAVNDDILEKNPAKNCAKEYNKKSESRKALTREQQKRLLNFVEASAIYGHYLPLINFMLSTACRAGECMGLTWNDIDFKNRVINITHQLRYLKINGEYQFFNTTPKSEAGTRIIPITDTCYNALIRQKELQFMLGVRHDIEVAGLKNFVFTTRNQRPYDPNNLNKMLSNIENAYNKSERKQAKKQKRDPQLLPHISCHVLRHTACTRLAEKGIDIKVLQVFMGHSDIKTTMNIYNHVDDTRIIEEVIKADKYSKVI